MSCAWPVRSSSRCWALPYAPPAGRAPGRGQRAAAGIGWVSALLALMTAVLVALRGALVAAVDVEHGQELVGLWANQLTVILMVLVAVWVAAGAAFLVVLGCRPDLREVLAHRGAAVLLVFAAATVTTASWSWWGRPPASARLMVSWATALLVAGPLYGLVLVGLGRWVSPALPAAAAGTISPWWLAAVAGAGIVAGALTRPPSAKRRLTAIPVDAATAPGLLEARGERGQEHSIGAGVTRYTPGLAGSWEEGAA